MRRLFFFILLATLYTSTYAQELGGLSRVTADGRVTSVNNKNNSADSLGSNKEIPKGIKVWTVDSRFGDIRKAEPDTLSPMFMNTIFTTGLRGEYNTTGNLGAPRINRIFIDRAADQQFSFVQPYDYFITPVDAFHFTNTLSPFTNLTFNTCGNRTNGEDHFTAKFGVNAGKRLGLGFKFDYLYGRGYYSNQNTSHFDYALYASYLGDHYQAHFLASLNHQKVSENGGITNDNYITHPESFNDNFATSEIPTVLEQNWNRNDNQHIFFSHRYNLGFHRNVKMTEDEIKAKKFAIESQKENAAEKEKMQARRKAHNQGETFDEEAYDNRETFAGRPDDAKVMGNLPTDSLKEGSGRIAVTNKEMADSLLAVEQKQAEDTMWMKREFVPVTSFIHTVKFDNYRRIYQAYDTPDNFYANTFTADERLLEDSIYDKTSHWRVENTFAIALLEGFNKWAKAGLKAFITHELRHFEMPDTVGKSTFNENSIRVGGMLNKTQGSLLHYNVLAEVGVAGADAGTLNIDGNADVNFKLFGDTVQLAAKAFFHRTNPTFYFRHYHGRHFWWDNDDMDKIIHSRIEGIFSYKKTNTSLRVAFDELKNYTYFAQSYTIDEDYNRLYNTLVPMQHSGAISLLTLSLAQDFTFGPVNWQSVITYQKSSDNDVLAVPDLNIYTNLFVRFKIARVLKCDFGADLRYFTKYYAPDYSPALGQYTVQSGDERVEIGNYPIVNVYANFHLKHTRFFVMLSHANYGTGNRGYFLTPHYPLNQRLIRFGLSWNFFN